MTGVTDHGLCHTCTDGLARKEAKISHGTYVFSYYRTVYVLVPEGSFHQAGQVRGDSGQGLGLLAMVQLSAANYQVWCSTYKTGTRCVSE